MFTTAGDLANTASDDAMPGEFDLLDARSLMERRDYTRAVRRTVTSIEALLRGALLKELEKKYSPRKPSNEPPTLTTTFQDVSRNGGN